VYSELMSIHWVEIVRVRLASMANADKVRCVFEEFVSNGLTATPLPVKAVLYKSAVPTDWSIHLVWAGEKGDLETSPLGTCLLVSLRELGIVNYSTWEKHS